MQHFGDYRVIRQIGEGSFGTTFHVEHRFIKRQFVLKMLPEELCQDPHFLQAFEEETSRLATLDHPNIVKIHNVSSHEGRYFLVTDFVGEPNGETQNLAQYLGSKKESLKEEELYHLAKDLASALDHAHVKGPIIHRCLKLSNILVGKQKTGVSFFITDFGLSKIISPAKALYYTFKSLSEALNVLPQDCEGFDESRLSQVNRSFMQNYYFFAPEQKKSEQVTLHADVYAFGILLYYCIAKQFPEGSFPLPSQIAPHYNHDWDFIITECLRMDPLKRPPQLTSLLEKKCAPFIKESVPRPIAKEKAEVSAIEKLKDRLLVKAAVTERKETLLKPVIKTPDRKKEEISSFEIETSFVESKDVTEATPLPINPSFEESYKQTIGPMLNRDPIVTKYQPERKETKCIDPLLTEMAVIQGGEFIRGSSEGNRDENPRHCIYIDSYALDIHPVTNEQFVRFLEYMGGEKDQNYYDLIRLKESRINRSGGKLSIEPGYGHHPVVGVTWYGACSYARWVGKRLPTEAEWEIACLGGAEGALYPTGDTIEKGHANFFSSDTTAVMCYPPNSYGLYDIVGNVYEWCQDWYGYNYYETSQHEPFNPKGPPQGVYRVLRGGCWKSLKEDLRCSHRHRNNPGTVNSTYGFRCAADVE